MKVFSKLILLLICHAQVTAGARDSIETVESFRFFGYTKALSTFSFDKRLLNEKVNLLMHNRFNFRWKSVQGLSVVAEFRNRLFTGEVIKSNPRFIHLLRNRGEQWNMQKIWFENQSVAMLTNTERAFAEIDRGAWNIRVGRQRINWGMTTTWNPNDIFNAWNFLDFDYEERAGVDGISMRYRLSGLSEISFVYALAADQPDISSVRYFFNRQRFDVQLTAGKYRNHFTAGVGWAGHIREAGFKGEVQYFLKSSSGLSHLNFTAEADHLMGRGWYLTTGFLFNSSGIHKPVADLRDIDLNLSAENLMPGRWSVLLNGRKEINPLSSGSMGIVYSPGLNLLILLNTISYNVRPDLDTDVVLQSYFAEAGSVFQATSYLIFLRVRWSF